MRLALPCLSSFIFCLCFSTNVFADEGSPKKISFNCWIPEGTSLFYSLEGIYREVFSNLGYEFEMKNKPPERSVREVISGSVDGLCIRSKAFGQGMDTLEVFPVDVEVVHTNITAFAYSADVDLSSLTSLEEGNYQIGYFASGIDLEWLIGKNTLEVTHVPTELALKMLKAGRLDVVISVPEAINVGLEGLGWTQEPPPYSLSLNMLSGTPFLHKKHKALAVPFRDELIKVLKMKGIRSGNFYQN